MKRLVITVIMSSRFIIIIVILFIIVIIIIIIKKSYYYYYYYYYYYDGAVINWHRKSPSQPLFGLVTQRSGGENVTLKIALVLLYVVP